MEEASGLRVALVRIHRQLRARSGSDITLSQSSALARIEQEGPVRLGTLAELEGTTAATMSRVIDSLADRHLIERVADPLDGRARLVQLSPEGGACCAASAPGTPRCCGPPSTSSTKGSGGWCAEAIPVLERLSDLLQALERHDG